MKFNRHIDHAIDLLQYHEAAIEFFIDIVENSEDLHLDFFEDKLEVGQNFRKIDDSETEVFENYRKDLEYHQKEYERAKVRLDICMRSFNGGWHF